MRCSLVALVVLASCQPEQEFAFAAPATFVPRVDPIAKGVPHGSQIFRLAVTEQGDAALTFDTIGGLRLWPALDGSRTPVPVFAHAPAQLSLTHTGRDLLAVIGDDAGAVSLMKLGRDGSIRARAQLPGDVHYEQVIAVGDVVLARTADHAVEWFTAQAQSRGRVVVDAGWRIQAIAARNGRAAAIVTDGTHTELRWLEGARWGKSVRLPRTVHGELLALSPDHRRIVFIEDKTEAVVVVELEPTPKVSIDERSFRHSTLHTLGFIDNERVAVVGFQVQWVVLPPKHADPWANTVTLPVPARAQLAGGGIANGLLVTGNGSSLALTDRERTRYLGYQATGTGMLTLTGKHIALAPSGSHLVWLDDKLAMQRDVELQDPAISPWVHATPIGERHVITQRQRDGKTMLELVDLDKPKQPTTLGAFPSVERMDYAPESGLLAVGLVKRVKRFKLDLARTTAVELPELEIKHSLTTLRLLDPERADGAVALTYGWAKSSDENHTLALWRLEGGKLRHEVIPGVTGLVHRIEADGTYYLMSAGEIQVRRGSELKASFKVDRQTSLPLAIDSKGTRYAAFQRNNELVVLDGGGHVLWRKPMWGGQQVLFSADDKRLIVRVNGGLLAFDVATGEQLAMECGWNFGITTTPPVSTSMINSAPVCEDPTLL